MSTEKAGLPETILFKRQEGGKVEEVARWGSFFFFFFFAHGAPRGHKMIFRFPNPLTKWVGEPMIGINDAIKITHIVEQLPRYGGDYTMASLRLFLASKAGLSITMEGCIKWVK